jgi:hypothetical protein
VKHRFLLDFNIIYHAVRGVDEHDQPDMTCAELLLLIGRNCHTMVVNSYLYEQYLARIYQLFNTKAPALPPIYFVGQLLFKAEKFSQEMNDPPLIPDGVSVPREDIQIVRSALASHPILVAADGELRDAVNKSPILGVRAVRPAEALVLAQDS